jgi:hypothetical protein
MTLLAFFLRRRTTHDTAHEQQTRPSAAVEDHVNM